MSYQTRIDQFYKSTSSSSSSSNNKIRIDDKQSRNKSSKSISLWLKNVSQYSEKVKLDKVTTRNNMPSVSVENFHNDFSTCNFTSNKRKSCDASSSLKFPGASKKQIVTDDKTNGDSSEIRNSSTQKKVDSTSVADDRIDILARKSPGDAFSSRESASKSSWSLSFSTKSPDRSMTSLANDWQNILGKSENSAESTKSRTNNCNDSTTVTPLRRALFSPTDSSKMPSATANSPARIHDSPSLTANRNQTPTKRGSRSSFSPKKKCSPLKTFKERVDTDVATRAVENLNLAKQGAIRLNDFDLTMIYAKKSFEFEYGVLNTDATIKYEARDVNVPEDKQADHFFMILVNVFSEPVNCGYFNQEELDTIFSILTLTAEAQSLLTRMLKRKRDWHRVQSIAYPEIGADLQPVFEELVDRRFFDDDILKEDMPKLLNLLQVEEIRKVCHSMKVSHKGAKSKLIENLVQLSTKNTRLFSGAKSPSEALKARVYDTLGSCIRLSPNIDNLLNRIFILLIPSQDPKENIVDAFRLIVQVHLGDRIFPPMPKERCPIFRNRLHLIRYAEARNALNRIINAIETKDWDSVRILGHLAYNNFEFHFQDDDEWKMENLPSYVKRFDASYVWSKVLWKSVQVFKKPNSEIEIASKFLQSLINRRKEIPGNAIRWYSELALIEMHHKKNLETSANITIEALSLENLSEIDIAVMLDRARKIVGRSKGISDETKQRISSIVRLKQQLIVPISEPIVNCIDATMISGNTTGSKSTWSIPIVGGDAVGFVTVEQLALHHYLSKGFRGGLHCEGALPVTLFATLFWNEIYGISVPGAFLSAYQDAPLDLYSCHFIENRCELIENKLRLVESLDLDCLSQMMYEDFAKYRHYQSLIQGNLFGNAHDFKDCITCLGINGVVGICRQLASNYNQWKSGFPDLFLWDPVTRKCKIVEVKGPNDSLSIKQKLWIQFLEGLGVSVEVCIVKASSRK